MKVKSYALVAAEIEVQLDAIEYDIDTILGRDLAVTAVLNIYMTADSVSGYGQDFLKENISIVTSAKIISVIYEGRMSYIKQAEGLVRYEDLGEDIEVILNMIQAAIDRLNR